MVEVVGSVEGVLLGAMLHCGCGGGSTVRFTPHADDEGADGDCYRAGEAHALFDTVEEGGPYVSIGRFDEDRVWAKVLEEPLDEVVRASDKPEAVGLEEAGRRGYRRIL